ncbi:hypothetical protein CEP53_003861 [Fusarium sp. AF-6]|nr:hypothetical protein CEP53_003861 [Fusarium sp. AF-6]
MAEPGTLALDLAALFSETRRVSSQVDEVQKSLKAITASIRQHIINTYGDNSATRIETSRDPTNDGSGDDTPMQEAEDSLSAAALQGSTGQAAAADSRPDPSGEQEHESEDLAKRAAEGTAFKSPQAHEDKGGPEPIVANDQPAESRGLENHLGRRVGMSTPDGHTTTPLLITTPTGRGDIASS